MKLFLVKVGRKTRSGNIQELVIRSVSVPDEATKQDLYRYFCSRYEGFHVLIEQPKCEALPNMPTSNPAPARNCGSLAFKIKYDTHESALFNEYCDLVIKANEKLVGIESSIRTRYKRLPYVAINNWYDMDLFTDDAGTFCKKLPIKSDAFFKVVKDCDDGTAELEVTENTESDDDLDAIAF